MAGCCVNACITRQVENIRDGRSFSVRRVSAYKREGAGSDGDAIGPPLCISTLSYQCPEPGLTYAPSINYGDHPDPDTLEGYSWNQKNHDFREDFSPVY